MATRPSVATSRGERGSLGEYRLLLKIAAGGPQDLWDIHELMNYVDRPVVLAEVDASIGQLPSDAQTLWARVRSEL